jgi:diguanylate cyclase (GGDEF)-like protein
MKKDKTLQSFLVDKVEDFSPAFVCANADVIPHLFQISLLGDLDVRTEKLPELFLYLMEQITSFDTGLIYIWEPTDMWFCRGVQGQIPESLEQGNLFTYTIRKTAKSILIPDTKSIGPAFLDIPFTFSSMIGLPIFIDTHSIGCVELYRKGGTPFTIKDVTLIKHLLMYSEKALNDCLGHEGSRDNLLNLRMDIPQRHVVLDILHQYEEQAKRLIYPLSIAIVAIENAERFGQQQGVLDGTRTLKTLARRIKEGLRCYDRVLRYEEYSFFVILPGSSTVEATTALRKALAQLEGDLGDNLTIGLVSMPDEAQDAKGLINAAHQALSFARKNGLHMATYTQTGAIKPTNLSLELALFKILHTMPSFESLDNLLELWKIQCQADEITRHSDPPGMPVSWDGQVLGYLRHSGLSQEICQWIISYLSPAWAVAAGRNTDMTDWHTSLLLNISVLADIRAGCPMGYSLKVADQLYSMARTMGREETECLRWATSALAANIGYLGIPTSILTKDEVNTLDKKRIKAHPLIALRMVRNANSLNLDKEILAYHHEHMDGSGYPRGLNGDDIPEGARALRVVDTFNAMISPRLYRPQKGYDEAYSEMTSHAGSTLDPDLTELYMGLIGSSASGDG